MGAIRERLEQLKVTDPELIHDTLEGGTDIFEIMDWTLAKLGDEDYFADAIKTRIEDLGTRLSDSRGRSERLRDTLLACLQATGEKSVRRPEATISLRDMPPSILAVDDTDLPDEFWKVERKVSRTAINAAIKEGKIVPGVTMSNGGQSLSVRRK